MTMYSCSFGERVALATKIGSPYDTAEHLLGQLQRHPFRTGLAGPRVTIASGIPKVPIAPVQPSRAVPRTHPQYVGRLQLICC